MTYQTLIEKLKKATGPDRELDAHLACVREPAFQLGYDDGAYSRKNGWIVAKGVMVCNECIDQMHSMIHKPPNGEVYKLRRTLRLVRVDEQSVRGGK